MSEQRPRAKRRTGCLVRLTLLALVGFALVAGIAGVVATRDVRTGGTEAFDVARGESLHSVLRRLQDEGRIVRSPLWALAPRAFGTGACLQAGTHVLPSRATAAELLHGLCQPAAARDLAITIPEGTNIYQLADRLAETPIADRDVWIAHFTDAALAAELGVDAPTLEGYLAPDTFFLSPDAEPADVVRRLHEAADTTWDTLTADDIDPLAAAFDRHALLTIASIVEEEAVVADERPRIARVIYNRIARGMQIQCDPTCVYGPDTYLDVPTRALCRSRSSTHSTYVLPGLPPTPISNPGRSAIEATLRPADDPDVLYFVAIGDGSGRHAFADTLEAHNRNVDRYIRGR